MFKKIILSFLCLAWFSAVNGKTILVTGASGDIGGAVVKRFVDSGHTVIAQWFKNKTELEALQKQFPNKVVLIQADFSQVNEIPAFWSSVLKLSTQIDIVVNSAGIEQEDTSFEQIQRTMNINYLSPRLICDAAMDHFQKKNILGIIVNLGSRAAFKGLPKGYYTYADSKSALTKYSQDLAKDNAKHSLVYVVAPGPVEGKMFEGLKGVVKTECLASMPTGRVVKVQEVVDVIEFFASGKVPSGTGGVFDLMGASWAH
ncbi:MAG: SDR family oxidoreductase [Alphaproteobacteria bacterium]|nr:SDR family oxidoreductase [Alphaproteobacteria bacterium]